MNRKVTVVGGAGNVGATVARCIADKALADVVIVDIADQKAAGIAIFAPSEHGRQPLLDGELGNFGSLHHRRGIRENEYRISARITCHRKRIVQFLDAAEGNIERDDPQSFSCLLSSAPFRLLSRVIGVRQHHKGAEFWKYVLEQFDPFSRQLERKKRRTGDVTARLREALDEAQRYRVAALGKQDRNVCYRRHRARRRTARHGEIHVAAPQFGYHLAQRLGITRRVVKLKDNVLSLNVAEVAQTLPE